MVFPLVVGLLPRVGGSSLAMQTPPPPTAGGQYMYGFAPHGGIPPQGGTQAAPYSNVVKIFADWNACYSCGLDIPNAHNSMTCPAHLRKPGHDVYFSRQNAQQYIDAGRNCSTRNRHKTQFMPFDV